MNESYSAIFLDRDGIINEPIVKNKLPYSPNSLLDFVFCSDIFKFVTAMNQYGFKIFVVTNQPEVARGTVRKDVIESMHEMIRAELGIKEIEVCYHDNDDYCLCRKPKPGMIFSLAKTHKINLAQSFMIGDRWKDVAAGKAAGCKTIFFDRQYSEPKPSNPDYTITKMSEAGSIIINNRGKNE